MRFSYTITQKNQITLPRELRKSLNIKTPGRVYISFDKNKKTVKIEPVKDILDLAGILKIKKPIDAVKARELMEKFYERV